MNVVLQFAVNPFKLEILALAIKIRPKTRPIESRNRMFSKSLHSLFPLVAGRPALAFVILWAIAGTGSCAFLYFGMIPRSQRDDEALLVQQRHVYEGLSIQFRDVCDRLSSTEDTKESRPENKLRMTEICEQAFKENVNLLNYEARLRIFLSARNPKDTASLDLAIEKTRRSIDFYPNETALELQGLAYCLRSKSEVTKNRSSSISNAIETFRSELDYFPGRRATLRSNVDFLHLCPAEVRDVLYP
jgi:hypothetical protein